MHRCTNCGNTDIDTLDPQDNGSVYCESCDRVTRPDEHRPRPPKERPRRDLD